MRVPGESYWETKLTYGTWMFGHWHKDQDIPDYRARCLLDDVVEVTKC